MRRPVASLRIAARVAGLSLIASVACASAEPQVSHAPAAPGVAPALRASAVVAVSVPAHTPPVASGNARNDSGTTSDEYRAWIKKVVAAPVQAAVGEVAWAAAAVGDFVRFEPFRVVALNGNAATVEDADKKVVGTVPGSLVQVPRPHARPAFGDIVTYYDWRHDVGIAVVAKDRVWAGQIAVRFRDSQKVIREETANVVVPRPPELGPFSWVVFPLRGAQHRGLVFAIDAANVFVMDAMHHAWAVRREDVRPLAVSAKPFKVGDALTAYAYDVGYRPGVVERVFVPGFSYAVKLEGEEDARDVYVTDLVDSL